MEKQKDIYPNSEGAGLTDIKTKRAEKLVTAIFMVTDLIDKDEPLRSKLRSVSLNLLSDSSHLKPDTLHLIVSLINISTSIGLISDMNGGIINKELANLNDSIPTLQSLNFSDEILLKTLPQGHLPVRQEGVLSKRNNNVLYKTPVPNRSLLARQSFGVGGASNESKSDRRENILKLIKDTSTKLGAGHNGVTIKDISSNISDCSEKTIQRELISLLKDKTIQKTGEKRWSRYFI